MLATAFVVFAMSFLAATTRMSAQQNQNCCTYTIDVAGFHDDCFPFNVHTIWGNGFPPAVNIISNGITVHGLPWSCPPSSPFFGASINAPFGPFASFNNIVRYNNINGCCVEVRIAFDQFGCTYIYVRPC
jgi:hypothetical protein